MILAELLHVVNQNLLITVIDVSNNEIFVGYDNLPINMLDRTVAYVDYAIEGGFHIYVLGKNDYIEVYLDNGTVGKVWTDGGNPNYELLYGERTTEC